MMTELRNGIWSELDRGSEIDTYRRNLQRAYIDRMEHLMTEEQNIPDFVRRFGGATAVEVSQSDIRPVVRAELKALQRDINRAIGRTSDRMSRYHLQDVDERIELILNPNG